MGVTATEIAKMCGVSRATVDRALKNKNGIRPETRQRILEVVKREGYHTSYLGSSLSTGKTHAIGIIVFDLSNQHFTELIDAVENYYSQRGYFLYICLSRKDKNIEENLIRNLIGRQIDGIILTPIHGEPEFAQYLGKLDIPIVTTDNRLGDLPFVGADNALATELGMNEFYRNGYRTVHFVCPPMRNSGLENLYAQEERARGYQRFCQSHGDMRGQLLCGADYLQTLDQLLTKSSEKPGIFCSSDIFTLRIRKHLMDQGVKPGEVCSLMGFDGIDFMENLVDRPASVFYPAREIGANAAKLLDDLMHRRSRQREIILPCSLLPGSI